MSEAKPPKKMPAALQSTWRVRKAWDEDGWEIYPDYKTKLGDPCEVARTTDAHKAPRWVAELIADAGNTYNTTGLTPSQLVERGKELEVVLQAAVDCGMVPKSSAADGGASKYSAQVLVADRIRAALSKARPNTAEGE